MVRTNFSLPLTRRSFSIGTLLAPFLSGLAGPLGRTSCLADETPGELRLSPETLQKYKAVYRALRDLDDFLRAVGFERSALVEINYFAMSVGGIDALRDLEEGRGVDPETLAGLYAGYAAPVVARHLNMQPVAGGWKITSPDGRLRYKDTVVRLYSPAKLAALFARRESFREENERKRRELISEYVFARKREGGQLNRNPDDNEVGELLKQITELQPLMATLGSALQNERGTSSILQGETSHHFFGYSVGGIDVEGDLKERQAVDPETLAAIYAQRISPEFSGLIRVEADGSVFFEDTPIRLYSIEQLMNCYTRRNLLVLQAGRR